MLFGNQASVMPNKTDIFLNLDFIDSVQSGQGFHQSMLGGCNHVIT